jgi:hypothetical protein
MVPIVRQPFQSDDDAIVATNPLEIAFSSGGWAAKSNAWSAPTGGFRPSSTGCSTPRRSGGRCSTPFVVARRCPGIVA